MKDHWCSNYKTCRLVNVPEFPIDEKKRQQYMRDYCQRTQEHWSVCKRFIIKNELGTCPDFVLPDTTLSLPEIIAKFDEQQD